MHYLYSGYTTSDNYMDDVKLYVMGMLYDLKYSIYIKTIYSWGKLDKGSNAYDMGSYMIFMRDSLTSKYKPFGIINDSTQLWRVYDSYWKEFYTQALQFVSETFPNEWRVAKSEGYFDYETTTRLDACDKMLASLVGREYIKVNYENQKNINYWVNSMVGKIKKLFIRQR